MKKTTKARKYSSPKLRSLLDEVKPVEMEQTKVKMQLAARIEDMMKNKGWGKSQFAEKLDKNPSEITKWFSGTHNFTIEVLTEIAFVFGVELANLFGQKQTQVVYRKEIIVKAVVLQPSPYATPISAIDNSGMNQWSWRSQGNTVCLTPMFNA